MVFVHTLATSLRFGVQVQVAPSRPPLFQIGRQGDDTDKKTGNETEVGAHNYMARLGARA